MTHCYICGCCRVHAHHIFFGTANRKISDRYGYIAPLCSEHHTGSNGVHLNRDLDLHLKRIAQEHFENHHGTRDNFIKTFGKSYM